MKTLTRDTDTNLTSVTGHVSPDAFKSLFRSHPGPVAVVTAKGTTKPVGFTATSVISLSAEPPLLVFSVSSTSSSLEAMKVMEHATVHLLDTNHQDLAQHFATSGIDRFADLAWTPMPDGAPLITDVQSWAWGTIAHRFEASGSLLITLRVDKSSSSESRTPLLYKNRLYCHLDEG
ncbi:flavin reductase family protein [Microbacterium sp. A93]|uniref:flavin reductase family protein n=1 Tax=Microbacterium sp. A93 TaxID=3450716 RepID=UPI003F43F907